MEQSSKTTPRLWERLVRILRHWYGILLTLAVAVSALWLTATGQHTLYIHPRYTIFIVEMSALAVLACLWAIWRGLPNDAPPTDHQASDRTAADQPLSASSQPIPDPILAPASGAGEREAGLRSPRQWVRRGAQVGTALLVTVASVMVLLIPPAPLSPSTAAQRGGGRATSSSSGTIVRHLSDLPPTPRISDWAMLLVSQTKDDLTGIPAHIDGFITTTPEIADTGYYVVRFTIVCCAVDAFPAQVPVYDPKWREHLQVGQWVDVEGNFQPTDADIHEEYMLHPTRVTPIPEPDEPYLF